MPAPKLSETDFDILRKIEQEQPVPPNYLIRLELLGLARDEASGARLTLAGRRALANYRPPPVIEAPAASENDDEEDRGRSRPRKKRYDQLF